MKSSKSMELIRMSLTTELIKITEFSMGGVGGDVPENYNCNMFYETEKLEA